MEFCALFEGFLVLHSPPIGAKISFGSPISFWLAHSRKRKRPCRSDGQPPPKLSFSATARRPQTNQNIPKAGKLRRNQLWLAHLIHESQCAAWPPFASKNFQNLSSRNGKEALPGTARWNFARFLRVSLFCALLQFAPKSALAHPSHPRKPRRRLDGQPPPKFSFPRLEEQNYEFSQPEFLFLSLFRAWMSGFCRFPKNFSSLFSFFCGFRA